MAERIKYSNPLRLQGDVNNLPWLVSPVSDDTGDSVIFQRSTHYPSIGMVRTFPADWQGNSMSRFLFSLTTPGDQAGSERQRVFVTTDMSTPRSLPSIVNLGTISNSGEIKVPEDLEGYEVMTHPTVRSDSKLIECHRRRIAAINEIQTEISLPELALAFEALVVNVMPELPEAFRAPRAMG